MRKQISLIGKRLAAGLLGAAMLFTAVGVAAPVEVKAANKSKTFSFTITDSNLKGAYTESDNPVRMDAQAGDELEINLYIVNHSSSQVEIGPTNNHFVVPGYNGTTTTLTANPTGNTVNAGESKTFTYRFRYTGTGLIGSVGYWTTTNPKKYYVARVLQETPTTPGTPGGTSTGSGTTTPGTTTGGTTPGTGTTTGSTTGGTGTSTDTKPATGKTEPSIPVHTHSYNWETLHEPTEEHDGEMVDICSVCGDIRQRVPITGFYLFQKETMDKVRAAAPNATVEVKTSKWISFHRMVMNALAERQDVTLKVSFLEGEYRGARKTLTIPAGTDTNALLNEEGYAGFKYLGGLFGLQ